MVTRTQANTAAGKALRLIASHYQQHPQVTHAIIRALVKVAKQQGTAQARQVVLKMLQELYTDATGLDSENRRFRKWVQKALSLRGADDISGIGPDDVQDPTPGGIP